jgi:hypothetical protein
MLTVSHALTNTTPDTTGNDGTGSAAVVGPNAWNHAHVLAMAGDAGSLLHADGAGGVEAAAGFKYNAANGRVGVNGETFDLGGSVGRFYIGENYNATGNMHVHLAGADHNGPWIQTTATGHATDPGDREFLADGDSVFYLSMLAATDSSFEGAAAISVSVDGTPADNVMPSRFAISVNPGMAGFVERFVIPANGVNTLGHTSLSLVNTVHNSLKLQAKTYGQFFSLGAPAAGIGTSLSFETQTDNAFNMEVGGVIESVSTDVTGGSEDFDLVFKTMAGGAAAAERLRISDDGLYLPAGSAIYVDGVEYGGGGGGVGDTIELEAGATRDAQVISFGGAGYPYAFINGFNNQLYLGMGGQANVMSNWTTFSLRNDIAFGWTNNAAGDTHDLQLHRDAADVLAQRRGTNAQSLRVYTTFTDAANYSRFQIGTTQYETTLETVNAGTGDVQNLSLATQSKIVLKQGGATRWAVETGGHWTPGADNSYDVGSTSLRARSGYFGTSLAIGDDGVSGSDYIRFTASVSGAPRIEWYNPGIQYCYLDATVNGLDLTFPGGGGLNVAGPITTTGAFAAAGLVSSSSNTGGGLGTIDAGPNNGNPAVLRFWERSVAFKGQIGFDAGGSGSGLDMVFKMGGSGGFWDGTEKLRLKADGTLEQRGGGALNLYSTFTDASNYERGSIRFSSSDLYIGAEKAGTGTARDLHLVATGDDIHMDAGGDSVGYFRYSGGSRTFFSSNFTINSGSQMWLTTGALYLEGTSAITLTTPSLNLPYMSWTLTSDNLLTLQHQRNVGHVQAAVKIGGADTHAPFNYGVRGGDLYLYGGEDTHGNGHGRVVIGHTGSANRGLVLMPGLPTSNPAVAGALWNDSGTLKISAG